MNFLKELTAVTEMRNDMGEVVFTTFAGWKAAVKKAFPDAWFDGDKDIANAFVGTKPYKHKETRSVGEWDGAEGLIFAKKAMPVTENAEELHVGDIVVISGNVQHEGSVGVIHEFNKDKSFVIVDLYGIGKRSFHSSDVSAHEGEEDDEDYEDDEDSSPTKFWVSFIDYDEHKSWIGRIEQTGNQWQEYKEIGDADYRWGQHYMSYLSPGEVMQWIHKDYSRGMDVEGPFYSLEDAKEYLEKKFGPIEEQKSSLKDKFKNKFLGEGRLKEMITTIIERAIKETDTKGLKKEEAIKKIAATARKLDRNNFMQALSDVEIGEYVADMYDEEIKEAEDVDKDETDYPKQIGKADEFTVMLDEDEQVHILDGEQSVRLSMPLITWKRLKRS